MFLLYFRVAEILGSFVRFYLSRVLLFMCVERSRFLCMCVEGDVYVYICIVVNISVAAWHISVCVCVAWHSVCM